MLSTLRSLYRSALAFTIVSGLLLSTSSTKAEQTSADQGELSFECASNSVALVDIRARLAVTYGPELAGRSCVAYAAASKASAFSQLAVVILPFTDLPLLQLYARRPDGGWTDLTPNAAAMTYDETADRPMIQPSFADDLPKILMLRATSEWVMIFDEEVGSYQVFPID